MTTTVTAKGQVTIPKSVRDLLGIVPGSKVDFRRAADGSVVLARADKKQPASRFAKLRGHAGKGLDTDAIMALTRGEGVTLVDTNVLLDLVTDDPNWAGWSVAQLEAASLKGPLLINDIVYAELAVRYNRIEGLDAFIDEAGLDLAPIPREGLFLAGKVFAQYRKAGGSRTGVLPDFFIGAHAAVAGLPLLTRDVGRYRTYLPSLNLIAPDG